MIAAAEPSVITAAPAPAEHAGAGADAGVDPAAPLLDRMTPKARALTLALRAVVREVMPAAREQAHLGWEVLLFSTDGKMRGMVAAIAFRDDYINLQLGDGALLPDPAHLVEGAGKRMRHVKLRSLDDVRRLEVRALLEAAARLRGL